MQATNDALAEEPGCAEDGDDRWGHSVPEIITALLSTSEKCGGSRRFSRSRALTAVGISFAGAETECTPTE
jgi:hypothetical protein